MEWLLITWGRSNFRQNDELRKRPLIRLVITEIRRNHKPMSHGSGIWRRAARLVVRGSSRAAQEWKINGVYGLRRLAARQIRFAWLRHLFYPFTAAENLASNGHLEAAIAFCRRHLGSIDVASVRSLRTQEIAWSLLADLLVVDGKVLEAERIYQRILANSNDDLPALWGLENLRRRNGYVPPQNPLKVHFFTIVLNGMPLIKGHIEEMLKLPFDWHWHVVEGIASLKHDTAWSRRFGGRADDSLHRNGLSNDGTSEYLDYLAASHPDRISLYRAPYGRAWDGKIEMIRAPLANIHEECLLWQIDADEFWTADQITRMRQNFIADPDRTAAYFLCYYFIRNLVITTTNTYGNRLDYEWLRVWRFRPGDFWLSHEPPKLCRRLADGSLWMDIATINPFSHGETLQDNLVFRHLAYVQPEQIRFKEIYYGYKNALQSWQNLPTSGPVHLRDYLPWVTDNAVADSCNRYDIKPPAAINVESSENFIVAANQDSPLYRTGKTDIALADCARILIVKLDNIGDSVLLSPFIRELRANAPHAHITLLAQKKVYNLIEACPHIDRIVTIDPQRERKPFDCDDDEFLSDYRQGKFDLAVVPRWDIDEFQAGFIAHQSGARRVVGFSEGISQKKSRENRGFDELYSDVLVKVTPAHEVIQNLELLRFMNGHVQSDKLEIWTKAEDRDRATDLMQPVMATDKIVAVCPGATHIGKIFPTERLLEILESLPLSYRFVLLGGPEDLERSRPLREHLGQRALDLCGKTTLREAIAILERCHATISMDSALAHFAAAVAKPVVIFSMHARHGGNDTLDQSPARFGPWCASDRRLIIQPKWVWPGCENGCRWRGVRPHCIGNIDHEKAALEITRFLEQHKTAKPPGPALELL